MRRRPAAVTIVVVVCYIEMVVSALVALLFIVAAIVGAGSMPRSWGVMAAVMPAVLGVVIGLVFCTIAVSSGVIGYHLGTGSRTSPVRYTLVTLVLSLGSLAVAPVVGLRAALVVPVVGAVTVGLLFLPRSRTWFARQ